MEADLAWFGLGHCLRAAPAEGVSAPGSSGVQPPPSTHVHVEAAVKEGVPLAPQMNFGNSDASSLFLPAVPPLYPFSLCFICCQSGIPLVKHVLLVYHLLLHQLS